MTLTHRPQQVIPLSGAECLRRAQPGVLRALNPETGLGTGFLLYPESVIAVLGTGTPRLIGPKRRDLWASGSWTCVEPGWRELPCPDFRALTMGFGRLMARPVFPFAAIVGQEE